MAIFGAYPTTSMLLSLYLPSLNLEQFYPLISLSVTDFWGRPLPRIPSCWDAQQSWTNK